ALQQLILELNREQTESGPALKKKAGTRDSLSPLRAAREVVSTPELAEGKCRENKPGQDP
ncbi:mCG145093, partial [Mus musculus]